MPIAGTDAFLDELKHKLFPDWGQKLIKLGGAQVTREYFLKNGFAEPILIPTKDELDLVVPEESFSIPDVAYHVGLDHPLEVIDVRSQDEVKMTMQEFAEFFYKPDRNRLLNVLSLEFSKTRMSALVSPPKVVLDLSLVETCWPNEEDDMEDEEDEHPSKGGTKNRRRPSVQKYCLMSMANSYTDFHVDFGGSSVWYHILWGEKLFYLIRPTRENLKAYRKWYSLPDHRTVFFPTFLARYRAKKLKRSPNTFPVSAEERDEDGRVYRLTVKSGNTVLLPSGWIHAVYTPVDSIVFGGNFMHIFSIPTQLAVYRMEKKLKTETKFLFPYFEKVHWFVADKILDECQHCISLNKRPPVHYMEAGTCLVKVLTKWLKKRKQMESCQRDYFLPERGIIDMSCSDLVKQLASVMKKISDLASRRSGKGKPSLSKLNLSVPISNSRQKERKKRKADPALSGVEIKKKKQGKWKRGIVMEFTSPVFPSSGQLEIAALSPPMSGCSSMFTKAAVSCDLQDVDGDYSSQISSDSNSQFPDSSQQSTNNIFSQDHKSSKRLKIRYSSDKPPHLLTSHHRAQGAPPPNQGYSHPPVSQPICSSSSVVSSSSPGSNCSFINTIPSCRPLYQFDGSTNMGDNTLADPYSCPSMTPPPVLVMEGYSK